MVQRFVASGPATDRLSWSRRPHVLARCSLPPMAADLGWSWFTGGAMNTANAAGYLVGGVELALEAAARAVAKLGATP